MRPVLERPWVLLLIIFAATAPRLYLDARGIFQVPAFSDALVYAHAIANFHQGISPYAVRNPPYLYGPLFVLVGDWIARLLTPALGWKLYLLATLVSLIGLPVLLARVYFRDIGSVEAIAVILLAPLAIAAYSIQANIGSLCYFAALLAAAPGVAKNRWWLFYAATGLAAVVKINFLALLLLPLLVGSGQMLPSVLTAAAAFGAALLEKIFAPDLYRQFHQALVQQILIGRDYGYGLFGVTANLLKRLGQPGFAIPGAAQILFTAALLLTLVRLRRQADAGGWRWLALVMIAIVLVNPRMHPSDMCVALIPAYLLLRSNLRFPLTQVLVATSLVGFIALNGTIGFLLFFTSALIAGIESLKRQSAPELTAAGPAIEYANQ